jgi:hypothetical protein
MIDYTQKPFNTAMTFVLDGSENIGTKGLKTIGVLGSRTRGDCIMLEFGIEIEIVYNNTGINRLLSLARPCYATHVLLSGGY